MPPQDSQPSHDSQDPQLAREIASQPDVIARLLERELARIGRIAAQLPPFDYALIAARGSSDHAALYAKYAWGALAGLPVALAAPSLHTLYDAAPRMAGALVVGVSQSGQSPDIAAVLRDAKAQGRPTLAITNDGASPLAAIADHVVELHAGPERSVAATKTYVAELATVAAFAAHWAAQWSGKRVPLLDLERAPEQLRRTYAASQTGGDVARLAARLRDAAQCAVIGRGFNYATARELSLKLKELTRLSVAAYSSADFRHGPIATVEAGSPAILLAPSGHTREDMRDLAGELARRGADLAILSDDADALALAHSPLPLEAGVPEWLSPLVAIVPGQLLALRLALARGLDPDAPRGLRKVTRTL